MEELRFDVMIYERFIKTFIYRYNPSHPVNGNDLSRYVEDKLPTLKGKPYRIVLLSNKPINMVF